MTEKLTNKRALAGILMSAIALIVLTIAMEPKLQAKWQAEQLASVVSSLRNNTSELHTIHNIDVEAKGAIVYEINTGKTLYNKHAEEPLPLASVTKLITALVADEVLGQGARITINQEALETEGESGLLGGDTWVEGNLSDFMLTVSSNDAATALAIESTTKAQFIAKMNLLVSRLGLRSMVLINESGLDIDEAHAGAYGSAKDVALLLSYISSVKPNLLEATTFDRFISVSTTGKRYRAVNTNKIVGELPGLIGGKTGYTDIAGGNLVVIFDAGMSRYVAVVVLGSSKDGRFTDMLKLVEEVI